MGNSIFCILCFITIQSHDWNKFHLYTSNLFFLYLLFRSWYSRIILVLWWMDKKIATKCRTEENTIMSIAHSITVTIAEATLNNKAQDYFLKIALVFLSISPKSSRVSLDKDCDLFDWKLWLFIVLLKFIVLPSKIFVIW